MKRYYDLSDVTGCEPGALPDYRCEPIEEVGTSRPRHMLLDEDKAEAFRRTLLEYHAIQMQLEREYEELYKTVEWVENENFAGYSPTDRMIMDLYAPSMRRYLEAKIHFISSIKPRDDA